MTAAHRSSLLGSPVLALVLCSGMPGASAQPPACDASAPTYVTPNFAHQNLRGKSFRCATLIGANFIHADLSGADFSNATFKSQAGSVPQTDFTFANLTGAIFTAATFLAPTYFSYATLTSARFDQTDLSTPNAIFGDEGLSFDPSVSPRPSFANTTLNCEFVAQWRELDLSGARGLQACAAGLAEADLHGAMLAGADLSSMDLHGSVWSGAQLAGTNFQGSTLDGAKGLDAAAGTVLTGALFSDASLRFVSFAGAALAGAVFSRADLESADFSQAQLANEASSGSAARFDGAHLMNASFRGANLASVSFVNASLYGSAIGTPPKQCLLKAAGCPPSMPPTGATCSCATLQGANLTRTNFQNALLYRVDFSTAGTVVNGTTFDHAILIASDFDAATFRVDTSQGGAAPSFVGAWLQGVDLSAANLAQASLAGAYVDFGVLSGGQPQTENKLSLQLGSAFTRFANWRGAAQPCVVLGYADASVLPTNVPTMTCPDGKLYPDAPIGCGAMLPANPPSATNPRWFGGSVAAAQPMAWYRWDATYDTASAPACNGQPESPLWFRPSRQP